MKYAKGITKESFTRSPVGITEEISGRMPRKRRETSPGKTAAKCVEPSAGGIRGQIRCQLCSLSERSQDTYVPQTE